jgi:hypothetical protein
VKTDSIDASTLSQLLRAGPDSPRLRLQSKGRGKGTLLTSWTKFSLGSSKPRRSRFALGERPRRPLLRNSPRARELSSFSPQATGRRKTRWGGAVGRIMRIHLRAEACKVPLVKISKVSSPLGSARCPLSLRMCRKQKVRLSFLDNPDRTLERVFVSCSSRALGSGITIFTVSLCQGTGQRRDALQ